MKKAYASCPRPFLVSLLAAGLVAAVPAGAVTIEVRTADGFQEGFNDPTPVTPVPGNPFQTRGGQRRRVFEYAAEAWGRRLQGNVKVVMRATFDNLGGTSVSAVVGSVAPTTVHTNFPGAPFSQTWYLAALANQLYGDDQNDLVPGECPVTLSQGNCPEIVAQFNSAVDNNTVLGPVNFYYGLDGNSGNHIDFLSVALHEIAHGLGVLDLLEGSNGALFLGQPDAYVRNLEDAFFAPRNLAQMTNQQRFQAIRDDGRLVWIGQKARDAGVGLVSGRRGDGAIKIYAPATYVAASSTAHVDTTVSPDELMEPFTVNPPPRNLDLTLAMLEDVGWQRSAVAACGDATGDGMLTSSDALVVLRGSVGSSQCEPATCDVNLSFTLTTADAQLVLRSAVGQDVALRCPLA